MGLVVETGAGVAGANSLCHPGFAASYHADRGGLTELSVAALSAVTFSPPRTVSLDAGEGANVPAGSVVELEGAAAAGNAGFAFVDSVSGDDLTVSWFDDMEAEGPVAVLLTVFEKSGWTGTRRRLEASLINATAYLAPRPWHGAPVVDEQGVPFPRQGLVVRHGSPVYAPGTTLPNDEVPSVVMEAVAELSLEDLSTPVGEVIRPGDRLRRKKIGPIEKEFGDPRGVRRYPVVERKLRGLHARPSPFRRLSMGA